MILENCKEDELLEREQYYLDLLEPWKRKIGYNIRKIADNNRGKFKIQICYGKSSSAVDVSSRH